MTVNQHSACVDAWLKQSGAQELSPLLLLQLFEAALEALSSRTRITLGEVTLTAIAERVVFIASEKFPSFATLEVEPVSGVQCAKLRDRIDTIDVAELRAGVEFVLVELLTVLGNLTAEILTHDLHAALLEVALPKPLPVKRAPPRRAVDAAGKRKTS